MPLLSIEMENDTICIESGYSSNRISGHLLLKNESNDDDILLPNALHDCMAHIRLIGKEKIKQHDNDIIIIDDTYSLSSSDWQYNHTYQGVLTSCSASSLSSTSSTSSFTSPSFIPSTTSLSSIPAASFSSRATGFNDRSKLCWGMSDQSQWQYELELPQLIDASQSFVFTLRTRMRCFSENHFLSSSRKKPASLESCMIGVQLYESVQIGSNSISHKTLMTTSHVLSQPSLTWTSPCTIALDLIQTPTSSTLYSSRIKVNHHLQIVLNYCSPQGQNDRICFDCIVPLIAPPPSHLQSNCNHVVDTMMNMMIQPPTNEKAFPVWFNHTPDLTLNSPHTVML
ncbi:hypothetical protein BCR42DRAFT_422399 [Absidia repens]|uniref:Uncharacterized protein n=1 Tax=Absidia repens TaxID=90262 RepID=A0A1X2I6H4_9FUNG|nr:hypothetical protein BCR42DRAFT_422399 [Absidia repens]